MRSIRDPLDAELQDVMEDGLQVAQARINCVQVGRIESVDPDRQTAEVEIQFRRRVGEDRTEAYPLLVDCPLVVLQGGGAYLDLPVAAGDYCLVLFCDRDIDTWWDGAQVAEPRTTRKHSLSDGFALVGVNPRPQALDRDGQAVRIQTGGKQLHLGGDSKRLVTHAELDQALQTFVQALNLHVHGAAGTPPTVPMSIDISTSETQNVRTGG